MNGLTAAITVAMSAGLAKAPCGVGLFLSSRPRGQLEVLPAGADEDLEKPLKHCVDLLRHLERAEVSRADRLPND